MILLRNSIFKFYDNHDIVEYMPNKVDRDKEEQEMKKKIRLLDDLPQLVEEKKTKKEDIVSEEVEETEEEIIKNYAVECDVLFHLAGVNRPEKEEEYSSGNVDVTEKLITYLKKNPKKVHIIFSSSIQADRENAYGVSKRKAEMLLQNYVSSGKATLSIYRLPNVFGKWCKPYYNSVVATICYNIARGKEIQIHNPDAKIELIYIDDVIHTWIQRIEEHEKLYEKGKGLLLYSRRYCCKLQESF